MHYDSISKVSCHFFFGFKFQWTPEGRRLVTGASSGEFTLWNGLTFNFETILQVCNQHEMHIIILNESQDMGMVGWLKQLFQWRHPRVWYNTDDHLWDMIYVPKEGTVTSFLKWKRVEIWRKILIEGFLVDPTWNSPN